MARPTTLKNRIKIAVNVTGTQKQALDRLADKLGKPWGEIVREGIDVMIEKHRKQTRRKP